MPSLYPICSLAIAAVFSVGTCFAGAITANGTCEQGNCAAVDSIGVGQSTVAGFNFTYTFANTDQYQVTGAFGAVYVTTTLLVADVTVSYIGNATNTSSAKDTLVVDFLQNFTVAASAGSNTSGFESMSGNATGGFGAGSSVQGQYFTNNGTAMAVMGPFSTASFAAAFTNQPYAFGPTTLVDSKNTFLFGAGSAPGSTFNVVSPKVNVIPEPSSCLLVAGGAFLLARRRLFRANR